MLKYETHICVRVEKQASCESHVRTICLCHLLTLLVPSSFRQTLPLFFRVTYFYIHTYFCIASSFALNSIFSPEDALFTYSSPSGCFLHGGPQSLHMSPSFRLKLNMSTDLYKLWCVCACVTFFFSLFPSLADD